MLSGGVTLAEALVERLGHSFWHHVRELDLSRSKLRELDALHADGFSNLRELNLDGNLISDVHLLPRLPALNVLRLNNNVIVTTVPSGRIVGEVIRVQLYALRWASFSAPVHSHGAVTIVPKHAHPDA